MRKPYSEDFRLCVIENYKNGKTKKELLSIFNIGTRTLANWIEQYEKTGSVSSKTRTCYRKRKFSDVDLACYIEKNPDATLEVIAEYFSVKHQSVWQRLKLLGITLKKKTFLYQERDEEKRKAFQERLAELEDQQIVYIDESGHNQQLIKEYARALRGTKVVDNRQGKRTKRINVVAGLLGHKLIAPLIYTCSTTAEVFYAWLEKGLLPELSKKSVIVLDNATFHKSEKIKQLIESHGHTLIFLPPYSPDLNPIENYWAIAKARIKNVLKTTPVLFDAVNTVYSAM
jgi:transposase